MNWAEKRKLAYILGVLIVLGSISYATFRSLTKVEPTCFDGRKNGGENGIDCGGKCNLYCANDLADPKILWTRTFPVTEGIVHALAYIEHGHQGASARKINYSFKIYDDKNTQIAEKTGSTFLGPAGKTAIVETLIKTKNMTPAFVRFSILPPISWEKVSNVFSQAVVDTSKNLLEDFADGSRLTSVVTNNSRLDFKDLELIAILYDKDGNAITTSKSIISNLKSKEKKTVYFTWSYQTSIQVDRIEVIPRFNPFTTEVL